MAGLAQSTMSVLAGDTAAISLLKWIDFDRAVAQQLESNHRLVSCFASPQSGDESGIVLNAVFSKPQSGLEMLRTAFPRGAHFPSLTPQYPFFHCFEREIHEQVGLVPTGHPWLKPIRFSGSGMGKMATYPFFRVEGKEVHEVGVGPIHAGVIEPGHFRFMCFGEKVHHLEIHLGYQHRGLETILRQKEAARLAPLIETAAGDTTVAHAWAYCQGLEALAQLSLPPEVDVVRGVALELERIAMHLTGLAGVSTDIAFLPGGSTYGRLRTVIINTSMRICGSRFSRSWLRPGGVYHGIAADVVSDVRKSLEQFQVDIRLINELFQNSMVVKHRLQKVGVVPTSVAAAIGMVGMAARASGQEMDWRIDQRPRPFAGRPLELAVEGSGDCWARCLVRIREIDASTQWILDALKGVSEISCPPPPKVSVPANSTFLSVVEGWRGEVFHFLETGSRGEVVHYRIQDPSLRNWFGLAQAVRDCPISDFPICNKSFDLSYCGNDL
ncbi:MAG: NADH-quinone oxidoreductase subunit C [Bdellovibrionales bacterium]|nr:NADH-quinone oxidoreductase subunit C [Bdellovibrionales bacterium]